MYLLTKFDVTASMAHYGVPSTKEFAHTADNVNYMGATIKELRDQLFEDYSLIDDCQITITDDTVLIARYESVYAEPLSAEDIIEWANGQYDLPVVAVAYEGRIFAP